MDCELCGRPNANLIASIEGVRMNVCERCSKHGKVLAMIKEENEKSARPAKVEKSEVELEVVDNFAEIIRKEREKRGLTLKQFAAAIAEKESYIDRIERDETIPDEKVARKIEKFFNIKLLEEVVVSKDEKSIESDEEITLGDVIEIKKKGKK
ncbi:MAG: multiprotein bridging factor aMBF1 [Candidatus Micrarchaeota archaeon]|nr:multiprotein bridging factor aMBF1 [Candidatus Micrarchaeota archaeon]